MFKFKYHRGKTYFVKFKMGDKGVLVISKTLAGFFALTIVALFVGEGKSRIIC